MYSNFYFFYCIKSLNVTVYPNYGYIITNGSIDGVLGDIQKYTLDVATGTILKEFRWNFAYFTAPVVKFW